jgi:hypothetical protein
MKPSEIERQRETVGLVKAILEGINLLKGYALEIIKGQKAIREDLRNLENLRPLKK